MKVRLLYICLFGLSFLLISSCKEKEEEISIPRLTVEDYIGKYSGTVNRERMAENGWIMMHNALVETIQTEIIITPIQGFPDQLMVYVSAYQDSIRTQIDHDLGYLFILDKPYSFYLRVSDFPKWNGNYDNAVATYGNMNHSKDRFGIKYLKDLNDSIYLCFTATKKISEL